MKIETFTSPSAETFVVGHGISVTVNSWSNMEGANIMIHGEKDLSMRMSGAFRWEEMDVICAAITMAKTA